MTRSRSPSRPIAAVGALTQGQLVAHYGGSYANAGAVITLVYVIGMVLIWFALLAACSYGLYWVWTQWRAYG